LKNSVREGKYVVLSLFVEDEGESYFRAALEKGVEGIVARRRKALMNPEKGAITGLRSNRQRPAIA